MKLGVDPTTPDIHLGHTVVLRKLREFQDLGPPVVLIIGDYTGARGGPERALGRRGPFVDAARRSTANAETYQEQAFKVLDRDRTEVRRNGEWLDMPMEDLFRLARTSTVAQILERDDFAKRYAGGEPISILELLYPLLQGYDSVAIESDVELGGTDQKFNVLLAREIQQAYGVRAAVDPHHADPAGHRRRAEDVEVARQLRGRRRAARGDVRQAHAGPGRRDAGLLRAAARRAARPGADAARRQARAWRGALDGALPRRGGGRRRPRSASTRLHVRHELPDEIEEFAFAPTTAQVHLPALLAEAFGLSRSEARRLLAQAGVQARRRARSTSASLDVPADALDGAVLQVGAAPASSRAAPRPAEARAALQCYIPPSRFRRGGSPDP